MRFYKIRHNRDLSIKTALASTFGEACEKIGWSFAECQLLSIT